jgi:hypothetical protein
MNESAWKTFLMEYNRELLSYEQVVEALSPELIQAGWLGYPGASESEVAATETRLTVSLPPSYRAFLKVSNSCLVKHEIPFDEKYVFDGEFTG